MVYCFHLTRPRVLAHVEMEYQINDMRTLSLCLCAGDVVTER